LVEFSPDFSIQVENLPKAKLDGFEGSKFFLKGSWAESL